MRITRLARYVRLFISSRYGGSFVVFGRIRPGRVGAFRGRLVMALVAGVASLTAAAPSVAAVAINGDPLRVYANTNSKVQARFGGFDDGEFDDPAIDFPTAGLHINLYQLPDADAPSSGYGLTSNAVTPVSGPTLAGSGTELDPYTLTSTYDVAAGFLGWLRVTQVLSYVNGDSGFLADYRIHNMGASGVFFRAVIAGDLFSAASDDGFGFYDATPPAIVGAENDVTGGFGGLVNLDTSPWSRFQEGDVSKVLPWFGPAYFGAGFSNTVDPDLTDSAVGVQWDKHRSTALGAGATDTFAVVWAFGHFDALTLFPGDESKPTGATESQTALALHGGAAVTGKTVRYAITGANPGYGAAVTDGSGNAAIAWTGVNAGSDTLTAFLDSNGDGTQQDTEPADVTTITWTARPQPPQAPTSVTSPPTLTASAAKVQHALRTYRIVAYARCDKSCTVTGRGTVAIPATARVLALRTIHRTILDGGRTKLVFRLSRRLRKAISTALQRRKRVAAKLTLVAKAGSLTTRPIHKTVRLVR